MKRTVLVVAAWATLSNVAWAQERETPPAPPAPPAPPVYAMPPIPRASDADWRKTVDADLALSVDLDVLRAKIRNMEVDLGRPPGLGAFEVQGPVVTTSSGRGSDAEYQSGLGRLQRGQFQQAIDAFTKVIAARAERVDAALYWKAFAEFKLAQHESALTSLAALQRDHPSSRYGSDARVLEADVRRGIGGVTSPASVDDDEIKLLAIQGLSGSTEAVPLLEGVLAATNSLGVKRRALYVLALSSDPKANDVLMRYARGAGNPDLQVEAIRYLGERSAPITPGQLQDIFSSTADTRVKLAVIEAYRAKKDKSALLKLVADRQLAADVRPQLFSRMNGLLNADEIMGLFRSESDAAIRVEIISSLGQVLTSDQLADIARTDADARVRQRAINQFGGRRTEEATKALLSLYAAQTDRESRRSVIRMLGERRNADALVSLARQESDLELRRELVRRLSELASSSKAAADFLMEQLR